MNSDEKILVLKLKHGDQSSFNLLYKKYASTLFHFAMKYLKSKDDAEEIVQHLFYKIWERKADLNEELSFKSYLFQIAVNDIYNKFKKQVNERKYHEYIKETVGNGEVIAVADNRFDFQDLLDVVKKAIDKFPPQRKVIFTLNKIDGYSINEIAEQLNLSVRTIENQVFRGVKVLRSQMVQCLV
jgi:RNA polymerase sigma-70 factor (ECF subfamily)